MMPEKRKTLCKFQVEGEDFYLLTVLHNEGQAGFDLSLSDGKKAWCGKVSEDDLDNLSSKVKMDFAEYVVQTKTAFTRENVGNFNFQYQVQQTTSNSTQLVWKKHLPAEDIKFQLGSVMLHEETEPGAVVKMLLNDAINVISDLKENITSLQSDNERLATERATALKRLEKCVSAKEEIENNLYSKFVTLLNEKKRKLRTLKEVVERASARQEELERNSQHMASRIARHQRQQMERGRGEPLEEEDDESSREPPRIDDPSEDEDEEYHTDDEKVSPPSKRARNNTSKTAADSSQSELILDDCAEEDIGPSTSSRRRRGAAAAKKTPSKPVIPKVSSTGATPEASGKATRARSTRKSSRSSRSQDVVDAEELFDDI